MISILDRFFLARIERALDDAEPLRGFTAWYVRRRPALRNYYETMLQMELELRFPENELGVPSKFSRSNKFETDVVDGLSSAGTNRDARRYRHLVYYAVAVLLLALTAFFLSPGRKMDPDLPQRPDFATHRSPEATDSTPFDLAELLSIAEPITKSVLPENSPFELQWSRPSERFSFPVESIVGFSEKPIESTLSFLERARVFEKHSLDEELMKN